jgi:hypothetical protein
MKLAGKRRTPLGTVIALLLVLSAVRPAEAYVAGSDVVVFWDACRSVHYTMNIDRSGLRALPELGSSNSGGVEVSRTGPPTLLAFGPNDPANLGGPWTLYAVDPTGQSPRVDLHQPSDSTHTDVVLSLAGDLLAYSHDVREYPSGNLLRIEVYIGHVVRDPASGRISGLSDVQLLLADLRGLGSPADITTGVAFMRLMDFSPAGGSLLAVVYGDLWELRLANAGTSWSVAPRALTRTKDTVELSARWSPTGDLIAWAGGPITTQRGWTGLFSDDMEIYTLAVASGAVRRVTTNLNKGSARGFKNDPNWSHDGSAILFSAIGPNASRSAPCGGLVNFDLFLVSADGSGKIQQVSTTVGSGVETTPRWGWR